LRLRRFDGEYRWIISQGVPQFDHEGVFQGFIGIAMDISQRKKAEDDLSRAIKNLSNSPPLPLMTYRSLYEKS
jgi:signal transduction histidine kinase